MKDLNSIVELRENLKQLTDNKEEFVSTCLRIDEINENLNSFMCSEEPLTDDDYEKESILMQELEDIKDKFGYNELFGNIYM